MAKRLKTGPAKRRLEQILRKQIESALPMRTETSNIEHRGWLARHMERQNGRCAYCGIPMLMRSDRGKPDRRATLDHVVPLARRGADSEGNTVAACAACNAAKADIPAQLFNKSAFLAERKAYAATISPRPPRPVVVKLRRTRPNRPS
jgi:5-methylcytosine-specific restriction endonuclease McrA